MIVTELTQKNFDELWNEKGKRVDLEFKIFEAIDKITVWLGSKEEYEEYVGYKVEFIRPSELLVWSSAAFYKNPILRCPFVKNTNDYDHLAENFAILKAGIEALVQAKPNSDYTVSRTRVYEGIPVRRKISKIDRDEIES